MSRLILCHIGVYSGTSESLVVSPVKHGRHIGIMTVIPIIIVCVRGVTLLVFDQ